MMLRLGHQGSLLIALALLFPIGASVPLACCAGVALGAHVPLEAASHCAGNGGGGESCCDRASDDAVARHCCQGGDAFDRPAPSQPAPAVAAMAPRLTVPAGSAVGESSWSVPDPVPRLEPLYTLHSSLLI